MFPQQSFSPSLLLELLSSAFHHFPAVAQSHRIFTWQALLMTSPSLPSSSLMTFSMLRDVALGRICPLCGTMPGERPRKAQVSIFTVHIIKVYTLFSFPVFLVDFNFHFRFRFHFFFWIYPAVFRSIRNEQQRISISRCIIPRFFQNC